MHLPTAIIEYILSFNRFHRIEFICVLNQLEYLSIADNAYEIKNGMAIKIDTNKVLKN